ncbi:MAG: nickel pincer cofactor biosynthesis protein LarB, partial [Oscillospiraceae bacterium]|nr:nickel pincer cofactor biosynthesis protein LarB [Oscillospiraceae bacterium]
DRGYDCVLITRLTPEKAEAVNAETPITYDPISRIGIFGKKTPPSTIGYIAVCAAGTSDLPVAEEAATVAEALGSRVERLYDVGVAGLHRLLHRLDTIMAARVVIAVAGMEGALATVIGGLVSAPVIAVPTSVGYGANFQGLSALLSMLNSCAGNVSVVNIDNGFGAGYLGSLINNIGELTGGALQ